MSQKLTVHFNDEISEKISEMATEHQTTKSEIVRQAVDEYFRRIDRPSNMDDDRYILYQAMQKRERDGAAEARKLKGQKYIETPNLVTAEILVNEYDFECLTVRGPRPEEGTPKLWILVHPDYKHEFLKKPEKEVEDDFDMDEDFLMEMDDDMAHMLT